MVDRPQDRIEEEVARIIRIKARRYAKRGAFRQDEREDLEQELSLHWLQKRGAFDAGAGSLLAYADTVLNNHIRNLIANRRAAKRDYRLCTSSLDEPVRLGDESSRTSRHDIYDQNDYFRESGVERVHGGEEALSRTHIERVVRNLPPDLQAIAIRLACQSVTKIARETGLPRSTIYDRIKRIRDVFAREGLEDYLR